MGRSGLIFWENELRICEAALVAQIIQVPSPRPAQNPYMFPVSKTRNISLLHPGHEAGNLYKTSKEEEPNSLLWH